MTKVKIPTDLLVQGVLFLGRRPQHSANAQDLHMAFAQLANDLNALCPTEPLVFLDGEAYPHSRLLEQIISDLSHNGTIEGRGPSNPAYLVASQRKAVRNQLLADARINVHAFGKLIELSERFEKLCPREGGES